MEETICGRAKSSERVRKDSTGANGDGKDDELPCVIGESTCDCV